MDNSNTIGDESQNFYRIAWEDNEDGPDERMIDSSHEFCSIIVEEAYDDPDATVKRI